MKITSSILFSAVKIMLVVLIVDAAIVTFVPVWSHPIPAESPGPDNFSSARFIKTDLLYMVVYLCAAIGYSILPALAFPYIIRYTEPVPVNYVGIGGMLSGAIYLLYAYQLSSDAVGGYLFWKVFLKLLIGGLFGFLFYLKHRKTFATDFKLRRAQVSDGDNVSD